ncbi:MAG: hypothetical protein GXY83_06330 [Rhodopirellula sp.]|nr:hypothetical protein [Rhodopirellula sp.]
MLSGEAILIRPGLGDRVLSAAAEQTVPPIRCHFLAICAYSIYPTPALGLFFGFYLCAVAVVLRLSLDNPDGRAAMEARN